MLLRSFGQRSLLRRPLSKAHLSSRLRHASNQTPQNAAKTAETQDAASRQSSHNTFNRWCFRLTTITLGAHVFFTYFYEGSLAYGISMLPTMNSSGDWLLISKYYRRGREIKVGDVVSFKHPVIEGENAVKRVIGMPGDFVLRDTPGSASCAMLQVPLGHCYVVGDNLTWSRDSRMFGPLPLALVSGKVIARFSPWPQIIENGLQPAVEDDED